MTLILPLLSYFLGMLHAAIFVSYIINGKDPRTTGSRNPGSSNMLRLNGILAGLLTCILDSSKPVAMYLIAAQLNYTHTQSIIIASISVLGHTFPMGRKGGRGVASGLGVCILASPLLAFVSALFWGVLLRLYGSQWCGMYSVAASFCFMITYYYLNGITTISLTITVLTCLIVRQHIHHIIRFFQLPVGTTDL